MSAWEEILHWMKNRSSASNALAKKAEAEINSVKASLYAWKSAYRKLEFDQITGECLIGCGGDSVDGHNEDCFFVKNIPKGETI